MENDYGGHYKNERDETTENCSNQRDYDSEFVDYESERDTTRCQHNCINTQLLDI